jgi:hypothetical protein
MFEPLIPVAEALAAVPLDAYGSPGPTQQLAACEQLARLEARVMAHQLAAARAAEASKAAKSVGATSTGAALANSFGGDPAAAARLLNQAKKVEPGSATEEALAQGEVSWGQAELIADKLKALPDGATQAQREGCETQLLDDAKKLSLKDLSRRADRISDTFAEADEADANEDEILRDRESEARKKSYL